MYAHTNSVNTEIAVCRFLKFWSLCPYIFPIFNTIDKLNYNDLSIPII